jgi:hypothetical protein
MLNASSAATIHLFVHAAAQTTGYLGFVQAPFFGVDVDRKLGEINATVEPGSRPVGVTVVGRVTPKPGSYSLTILVDATQAGMANPLRISEQIPVTVREGSAQVSDAGRQPRDVPRHTEAYANK